MVRPVDLLIFTVPIRRNRSFQPPGRAVTAQISENEEIADILDEVADILEFRGENPFRVRAYRRGAERLRQFEEPIRGLYHRRGRQGLEYIDGIGEKLSGTIAEVLDTGDLGLLTRLRAEMAPAEAFAQLPGIGPEIAERIEENLDIDSLEELEQAVYDGRLEQVPGIGPRKAEGISHALAGILNRGARRRARRRRQQAQQSGPRSPEPPVALLLSLDAQYRQKAREGTLRRIAPRRFNPERKKWLPVMDVERAGHSFTLLFSNTRRAHELNRTHDWVVIYVDDGDGPQYTVVTATSGPLRDKRVVRGREDECRRYYERQAWKQAPPRA